MNKLRLVAASREPKDCSAPKVISVLSGKGGVGKTIFTCNLAERMAAAGHRVLLVDADFSFGNVHVLMNAANECGLGMFAGGRLCLSDAAVRIADGLDMLSSESNRFTEELCDAAAATAAVRIIRQHATGYDLIVIDHASGKTEAATAMALNSDLNILIVVPELTSLADGYGLFKHLDQAGSRHNCTLVINRAESVDEADYVRKGFTSLAERFLRCAPPFLGYLPEDPVVKESVARQQPMAWVCSESKAVQALSEIGRSISSKLLPPFEGAEATVEKGINKTPAEADIKE